MVVRHDGQTKATFTTHLAEGVARALLAKNENKTLTPDETSELPHFMLGRSNHLTGNKCPQPNRTASFGSGSTGLSHPAITSVPIWKKQASASDGLPG